MDLLRLIKLKKINGDLDNLNDNEKLFFPFLIIKYVIMMCFLMMKMGWLYFILLKQKKNYYVRTVECGIYLM